jgi:hypothetical protein
MKICPRCLWRRPFLDYVFEVNTSTGIGRDIIRYRCGRCQTKWVPQEYVDPPLGEDEEAKGIGDS